MLSPRLSANGRARRYRDFAIALLSAIADGQSRETGGADGIGMQGPEGNRRVGGKNGLNRHQPNY